MTVGRYTRRLKKPHLGNRGGQRIDSPEVLAEARANRDGINAHGYGHCFSFQVITALPLGLDGRVIGIHRILLRIVVGGHVAASFASPFFKNAGMSVSASGGGGSAAASWDSTVSRRGSIPAP